MACTDAARSCFGIELVVVATIELADLSVGTVLVRYV
jgi:hypothetical protein